MDPEQVIENARQVGINRMLCVGTTVDDSRRAISFAAGYDNVWATVGVHPHDAAKFIKNSDEQREFEKLLDMSSNFNRANICAIGEIGLDYFKNYSSKEDQQKALRLQIETSLNMNLPYIFHVRDAWDDFWEIFDSYPNLRGVVHSFSAYRRQLDQALERGLFVGLNGIMTFTSDTGQLETAKTVPLEKLVLETDAPFLAPKPDRGKTCEPKHVADIARFLADLRNETMEELAQASTQNAIELFKLNIK